MVLIEPDARRNQAWQWTPHVARERLNSKHAGSWSREEIHAVATIIFAAPAVGIDAEVTYEFFGNPAGSNPPQGQVLLLRRTINGLKALDAKIEAGQGSRSRSSKLRTDASG